jgi:CBS domain-containing protein
MQARDLMTPFVTTVRAETPLRLVAAQLVKRSISAVPVTDDQGKILGIVSEHDIIARCVPQDSGSVVVGDYENKVAADIMTTPALTVEEHTPVSKIVSLIEKHRVKHLPVVREGTVIGIVSRMDLLRGTLNLEARSSGKSDRQLQTAIMEHLKRDSPHEDAPLATVTVSDGIVHFWGSPPTTEELEIARAVAAETGEPFDTDDT